MCVIEREGESLALSLSYKHTHTHTLSLSLSLEGFATRAAQNVREVADNNHLLRLGFCDRQFIDFKTSMITDYDPRRGLLFFAFVFQTTDKIRENAQSLDTECPTPLTHHFRHNGGRSQVISSLESQNSRDFAKIRCEPTEFDFKIAFPRACCRYH